MAMTLPTFFNAFALVLFLATVTTCQGSNCTDGDFQPAPDTNCTQYDQCYTGSWAFRWDCPLGTLWNQDMTTCAFPEMVSVPRCLNSSALKCTDNTTRGELASGCASFIQCGLGRKMDCRPFTRFAEDVQTCLPYDMVNTSSCTLKASFNCSTPGEIKAEKRCKAYTVCTEGGYLSTPTRCPPGSRINVDKGYCDLTTSVNTTDCTTKMDCSTPGKIQGVKKCREYTTCSWFEGILSEPISCSPGFLINVDKGYCDYESSVNTTDCRTKMVITDCSTPYEIQGLKKCREYATCSYQGILSEPISCSPGFLFNVDKGYCDYARSVNTTDCTTKMDCSSPGEIQAFTKCRKYTTCSYQGILSEPISCSPGFLINVDKGYCDYARSVNTTDCTTKMDCSVPGEIQAVKNCKEYTRCSYEGILQEPIPCLPGYLINLDKGYCDLESYVNTTDCTTNTFSL